MKRQLAFLMTALMVFSGFGVLFTGEVEALAYTEYIDTDFESGTLQSWDVLFGSPAASTNQKHGGSYSLLMASSSAQVGVTNTGLSLPAYGVNYTLWIYAVTIPVTTGFTLSAFEGASGGHGARVQLNQDTHIVYYNQSSATWADSGLTLATGGWHKVEIRIVANYDYFYLSVDDGTEKYLRGQGDAAKGTPTFVNLGGLGTNSCDVYADDILLSWGTYSESPPPTLEVTTLPLLTAVNDFAWYYDVDSSQDEEEGITLDWSLTGNITDWATIGSSTGNITGTPTSKGYYLAHVDCDNGTEIVYQNFTVRVYDIWWATSNGIKNPISAFGAAVYAGGKIFIGYLGECGGESPQYDWIVEYDGYNWSAPVLVDSTSTDDHGGASIIVDDLGYIHYFYGSHETNQLYKKSTHPYDITSWTTMPDVAIHATYPFGFFENSTNTMYLFYRLTVYSGNQYQYVYKTSTDHGTTWSSPTAFVDWGAGYAPYVSLGVYPGVNSGTGHNIMPFVWDVCNYSTYPTHKREDSFFAYMDLSDNHCYSITGTDLGTTITKAESLSHCLAYASGDNSLSGTTLYFDYATFTPYMTTVVENGSVADYIFFTYDGGWTDPQVVTSTPFWMGRDAMQMVDGHLQMFLQISMADGDRGGRIEQWELDDGVWTGVGIIADKFQATPGSYFADPVKIVGLENDWIFFGESKEDDFATELRVFAYNVSAGFLVNGTHVASPEPEPGTWAPAFTSTPVTTGKVGVLYSYAAGCNESVTWVLSADEFLSISAGGVVSGTPDHAGTHSIGIKATSVAGSNSTWQNYTLTVSEPSSGGTDPYDIPGGGGPDLDHPDWAKRIAGFAVILLIAIMIAAGVKMATSRRKGGRGGRRRR